MSSYYTYERREVLPLLPKTATNILEVGAATGQTLRWLKTIYPNASTTGVELNEELAGDLSKNADVAIIASIDDCLMQLNKYDLILLLDVLEHLADPGKVLLEIKNLLKPSGSVIVSVPNVAHLSVTIPLLFSRRFEYQDAGILDRTHLRFYVEKTAIKLLNDANFRVAKGLITGLNGRKSKIIDYLSLGLLRHHLAIQYIMLGVPTENLEQERVAWTAA